MNALFDTTVSTLNALISVLLISTQLIGVGLVIFALIGLANAGSYRSQGSSSLHVKSLAIGSLLIVVIKVLDVTSGSLLGADSRQILDYTLLPGGGINAQTRYMLGTVYAVIATVGFFGFVKGWMLVNSKQQQGQLGQGLVFIIAGTLAINLDVVMRMTAATVAQFSVELADNIRLFTPG